MPQYTNNIAITIPTLVGLAASNRADSTAIDNTTTQYDNVEIKIKLKLGATGVLSTGNIRIGILGSDDGGVTYDNNIFSSNLLETISEQPYISDGRQIITTVILKDVPQFWKLAVNNNTGVAFDGTGANFDAFFAGIDNFDSLNLNTDQINCVAISATLLASANLTRNTLVISNQGVDTIYLGDAAVTTSNGFALLPGDTIQLSKFTNNNLFGIVPVTTSLATIMEW